MMYVGGIARSSAFFGAGMDPIWLDSVGCTGSEMYLLNCSNDGLGLHDCSHSEDAGVMCGGATTPPRTLVPPDMSAQFA